MKTQKSLAGRGSGISRNAGKLDVGTDDVIEIGGTWLSPEHSSALQLCQERLGPERKGGSYSAMHHIGNSRPTVRTGVQRSSRSR